MAFKGRHMGTNRLLKSRIYTLNAFAPLSLTYT